MVVIRTTWSDGRVTPSSAMPRHDADFLLWWMAFETTEPRPVSARLVFVDAAEAAA